MMRTRTTVALLGCLVAWAAYAGCVNPTRIPGSCEVSSAVLCGASAILAGDKDAGVTDEQLGLVGYTCNGELAPTTRAR